MCNVLDHFHHLNLSEKIYLKKSMVEEIGYKYYGKAFHTNHPFYLKDIESFSHKNHILCESTWSKQCQQIAN